MSSASGGIPAREAKARLRAQLRDRLKPATARERAEHDRRICQELGRLGSERGIDFVLGYFSLRDEVNIDAFLCATIEGGRPVYLPRVQSSRIGYGPWRPVTAMRVDEAGIVAPCRADDELPRGRGLMVVPGRAFDRSGARLGRGGGHYDRILAVVAGELAVVGVAYECQIVESVPREAHDRDVQLVVTEASGAGRAAPSRAEKGS